MSKLEAQRAMRAARYDAAHAAHAASSARAGRPAEPAAAPAARPTRTRAVTAVSDLAAEGVGPTPELCGHRSSIGGKACKRPLGHTETTHRYA